jgi:hypothetical protein
MNKIMTIVGGSCLLLTLSTSFADTTPTDLNQNWTCTTNASTASTNAGSAADNNLANTVTSAQAAFTQASQNCRDCTKITCEVKS